MAEEIDIVQREAQPSLAIKATAASYKLPMIMGRAYGRIMEHMKSKGIEMSGAPYTLYQGIDWQSAGQSKGLLAFLQVFTQKWNMEIGVPVAVEARGEDEVIATTIPAGRYLRTLHRGPYAKVGESYERLTAYAGEQGLSLGPYSIESYLNDPQSVSKEQLETEVLIALLD
jgi:AraC family transcriptional regulator